MNYFRLAAVLVLAIGLFGCVSADTSQELVAATQPSATTKQYIDVSEFRRCLDDSGLSQAAMLASQGHYEASFTYKMARIVAHDSKLASAATRLRAYSVSYEQKTLLGKPRTALVICYYVSEGETLDYITYLLPDQFGKVSRPSFVSAGAKVYGRLKDGPAS